MFAGNNEIIRETEARRVSEVHTPTYFRNKIITRIVKKQHNDIKVKSYYFMCSLSEQIHVRS